MEKRNLRTYTIEMYETEDNKTCIERTNIGFTSAELLGLMEFIQMEIIAQIKGEIKPDIITRTVVKDCEPNEEKK